MTNRELLTNLGACREAVEWAAKYKTPLAAWKGCKRGDFLLWYCGRVAGPPDSPSRRKVVLVAAECAATALHLIADEETRAICEAKIQTCYAYAHGESTLDDVRSAANAAAYAADAAYAGNAADAAYADAAADAAYAANAAYAAYAAADAYAAARNKVLSECADIVRANYPTPPTQETP